LAGNRRARRAFMYFEIGSDEVNRIVECDASKETGSHCESEH